MQSQTRPGDRRDRVMHMPCDTWVPPVTLSHIATQFTRLPPAAAPLQRILGFCIKLYQTQSTAIAHSHCPSSSIQLARFPARRAQICLGGCQTLSCPGSSVETGQHLIPIPPALSQCARRVTCLHVCHFPKLLVDSFVEKSQSSEVRGLSTRGHVSPVQVRDERERNQLPESRSRLHTLTGK